MDSVNVIIIGANGFVGRHLARHYIANGINPLLWDCHSGQANSLPNYSQVDILRDQIDWPDGPSLVYYLSQSPFYRDFPSQGSNLFGVNAWGLSRVLETMVANGGGYCFYFSTGNVYTPSFSPLNENSPTSHWSPYASSKLMGEETLAQFRPYLETATALRLFGVCGVGQQNMLVPRLMQTLCQGNSIRLEPNPDGTGSEGLQVSLLGIQDVVSYVYALGQLACANEIPDIINIGATQAYSIYNIATKLSESLGVKPHWEYSQCSRCLDLIADVSLLNSLLNYKAISTMEVLPKVAEAYLEENRA